MRPEAIQITENTQSSKVEITSELLHRLLQQASAESLAEDEIDLAELWQGLMKRKWLILLLTGLVTLSMFVASILTTPQYQSSVKLMPVSGGDTNSGLMSKYGGLASLAGISLPSGGDISLSDEAIETLKSKRFLSEFILEKDLKKILFFKQWDSKNNTWLSQESTIAQVKSMLGSVFMSQDKALPLVYSGQEVLANGEPSVYQATEMFEKTVLSINEDAKSGLFSLSIKWLDPVVARDWANELVLRVDNELRQKAIQEAQATIDYMNKKLPAIELQDLRTIALQMIEENIKKITFAEVKKQYVFKVIDPAIVSEKPISPKQGLMVAVGFVLGLMLSVFLVLILNWRDNHHTNLKQLAANDS